MTRRFAGVLAVALIVILLGLAAMRAAGAPVSLVIAQGAAGVMALGLAAALATWHPDGRGKGALIACGLALIALASPFVDPGLDGFHRWLTIGPVSLQPAAIALPVIVWFAAERPDGLFAPAALVAAGVICALQPDQQAATGLAAAIAALLMLHVRGRGWIVALGVAVAAAMIAAFAPELAPVAYVEQVLRLSLEASLGLGLLACLALGATPLIILAASRSVGAVTVGLSALWLGLAVSCLAEENPTPVIGFGLSWVLGFGVSLGLAATRPPASPQAVDR